MHIFLKLLSGVVISGLGSQVALADMPLAPATKILKLQ